MARRPCPGVLLVVLNLGAWLSGKFQTHAEAGRSKKSQKNQECQRKTSGISGVFAGIF